MTESGPPPAADPEQQDGAPPEGPTTESDGPVVGGWVAPESEAPSPRRRAFAWIATLAILALAGVFAYRTTDGSTAYRLGTASGTMLAPILFAFVIFLIGMLIRRRPWRDAYRSTWLPLGALIVLALVLPGVMSRAAAPPPADPATAARIAPPWTLDLGESATIDQLESRLQGNQAIRSATVRHIAGPDGASAFLVVTDSAMRSDASVDDLARGLAEGSGGTASIDTIGDQRVVLVDGEQVAIASWVESPFLVTIYAADVDSARTIASAVLEAD